MDKLLKPGQMCEILGISISTFARRVAFPVQYGLDTSGASNPVRSKHFSKTAKASPSTSLMSTSPGRRERHKR